MYNLLGEELCVLSATVVSRVYNDLTQCKLRSEDCARPNQWPIGFIFYTSRSNTLPYWKMGKSPRNYQTLPVGFIIF